MRNGSTQKLTLFALTAMVVGGMVGSGIFSLPRTFANATGPFGAIIAWCIAAGGMYTLARVFQFLAVFGYWIGTCIGNVSYWVLIKATLGAFFPVLGDGNTVIAILVASARSRAACSPR